MPVAIAFATNLLLQIKDVLSKLDINSGTLKIDTRDVFTQGCWLPDASEKPTGGKSMILLIYTGPRSSSSLEAF